MLVYLSKRLLMMIPLLIGITLLSFFVIHLAPGKPQGALTDLNPKVSLQVRQRLEKLYHLDEPIIVQYGLWFKRFFRCDFGESFSDGRPVLEKILEALPVTLFINVTSMVLILLFGIPLGAIAALKKNSLFDKGTTLFAFAAFAMPTFWLALILMDLLGVRWGWLPVSGIRSLDFEYFSLPEKLFDLTRHLTLPIFVSSIAGLAGLSRYMRQNMITTLDKKFILGAYARGLSERTILYRHALRNAILPIITLMGLSIPGLIGGSVIFESIFAVPGTGRLFFSAVMARDYPVIMAMLVFSAVLTLIGNLLADVGYALADPRIRYAKKLIYPASKNLG